MSLVRCMSGWQVNKAGLLSALDSNYLYMQYTAVSTCGTVSLHSKERQLYQADLCLHLRPFCAWQMTLADHHLPTRLQMIYTYCWPLFDAMCGNGMYLLLQRQTGKIDFGLPNILTGLRSTSQECFQVLHICQAGVASTV